jgi:hypothetical protein
MGESSGSSVRLGLWLSFLAFLIIVVVFRSNLKEVSFSPEGESRQLSVLRMSKIYPNQSGRRKSKSSRSALGSARTKGARAAPNPPDSETDSG